MTEGRPLMFTLLIQRLNSVLVMVSCGSISNLSSRTRSRTSTSSKPLASGPATAYRSTEPDRRVPFIACGSVQRVHRPGTRLLDDRPTVPVHVWRETHEMYEKQITFEHYEDLPLWAIRSPSEHETARYPASVKALATATFLTRKTTSEAQKRMFSLGHFDDHSDDGYTIDNRMAKDNLTAFVFGVPKKETSES
ncbi:hypothetical protein P153DRAFT_383835 [Dothidotthia symphoricarpi CBS 119687]|uniref:Uncharacterized protein n=1 Tax=Dothidotthia symphoricarpi CBS 119687 TaxID=1392245 RepID=A0A6A6AKX8_9PLEO|nr:uncharacterized protein P153DRAFT_383835 [Dothidotthia symphoricarpi CBS 119687]KAF2131745.1 hypothetical protein P153DRAFT_383835 [Dothidotthia symphoricarpi CBS 119687]